MKFSFAKSAVLNAGRQFLLVASIIASTATILHAADTTTSAPSATPAPTTPAPAPSPVVAKAPAIPANVQAVIDANPNLIARIRPMSIDCVTGKPCANAAAMLAPATPGGAARSGEDIFNGVCSSCHGSGLLGSPKFGDKAAWGPRIAKGLPTLYSHAMSGFNAMPARGGNATLTDQEVKNAVDYMTSKSK